MNVTFSIGSFPSQDVGLYDGVLVTRVGPATRRVGQIASLALHDLGVDNELQGQSRNDSDDLRCMVSWCGGHLVQDVLLLNPEGAPTRVLHTLASRLTDGGIRLHLMFSKDPDRAQGRFLDRHADHRDRSAVMLAERESVESEFPKVPETAFIWFRSAARTSLSPGAFQQVDALFVNAAKAAVAITCVSEIDELQAIAYLAELLAPLENVDQVRTAIAGTQVGLLHSGWLLHVDLMRFLQTNVAERPTWRDLCKYREPSRAAVPLLRAMGFMNAELRELSVAHVAADGTSVDHPRMGQRGTPRGGDPVLRALLTDARLGDLDRPYSHFSDTRLDRIVLAAGRELGLVVAGIETPGRKARPAVWRERSGISLQRVAP